MIIQHVKQNGGYMELQIFKNNEFGSLLGLRTIRKERRTVQGARQIPEVTA